MRIHIDRNHPEPLTVERLLRAGDMHEGFKVQLVVEFYIFLAKNT